MPNIKYEKFPSHIKIPGSYANDDLRLNKALELLKKKNQKKKEIKK